MDYESRRKLFQPKRVRASDSASDSAAFRSSATVHLYDYINRLRLRDARCSDVCSLKACSDCCTSRGMATLCPELLVSRLIATTFLVLPECVFLVMGRMSGYNYTGAI